MKRMHALIVALALLAPGCSTVGNPDPAVTTDDLATAAEIAAYTGTIFRLATNPDERPIFEAVAVGLAAAVEADDYDPIRFMETLRDLPVRQIQSAEGAVIVGSVVILWERTSRRIVRLDTRNEVKPILEAFYLGMRRALTQ